MYPTVSKEEYKRDRELFHVMDYYQNCCIECKILFDTRSKYSLYCYTCLFSERKNEIKNKRR